MSEVRRKKILPIKYGYPTPEGEAGSGQGGQVRLGGLLRIAGSA